MVQNHQMKRQLRLYAEANGLNYTSALRAYERGEITLASTAPRAAAWPGWSHPSPTGLYLGRTCDGSDRDVEIDFGDTHILIGGTTGGAPLDFLNLIVAQWSKRADDTPNTYIVDSHGALALEWAGKPGVGASFVSDFDPEQSAMLLDSLVSEVETREKGLGISTPLLVVVTNIDAVLHDLRDAPRGVPGARSTRDDIRVILERGAAVGVHVLTRDSEEVESDLFFNFEIGWAEHFDIRIAPGVEWASWFFRDSVRTVRPSDASGAGPHAMALRARVQVGAALVTEYQPYRVDGSLAT